MVDLFIPGRDLDVSRIAPKLYQGSKPPEGRTLAQCGFDVLVLCAEEYQAPCTKFPGLVVLYCPMDDDGISEPTTNEYTRAVATARIVADQVSRLRRSLVSCQMGINRSGFVMALVLMHLMPISGAEAASIVQLCRPGALRNKGFVRALRRLPAPSKAKRAALSRYG